jgi:hypothetical protein
MFRNSYLCGLLVLNAGGALACEDEHPPVIQTPVVTTRIRATSSENVLSLAFDPRGVGSVIPSGEKPGTWIDTNDKTGVWHYREWQWWKGHPWGDSCRPRYFADVTFQAQPPGLQTATINYRIDGFDCRQVFLIPSVADKNAPYWDIVTTVRNSSGQDVHEYAQFFACYTPLNRNRSFWYWDESNKLVLFSQRGVGHLDGYVANPDAYFLEQHAIPHCPRGGGKIIGRWRHPVMVSHASPEGWRSIIMLEPESTAALAQGIEGGAMDYILFPAASQRSFAHRSEFSVHIRHMMLKSAEPPTTRQLEGLWNDFERSHAEIRQRAARQ